MIRPRTPRAGDADDPWQDPDVVEDAFPLGDGVADDATFVQCPYCGESVELLLDPGSGDRQQYVEDCEVCCQPWLIRVRYDRQGRAQVSVDAADGR